MKKQIILPFESWGKAKESFIDEKDSEGMTFINWLMSNFSPTEVQPSDSVPAVMAEIESEINRLQNVKKESLENSGCETFEQMDEYEHKEQIFDFECACSELSKFNNLLHRLESLENDFSVDKSNSII